MIYSFCWIRLAHDMEHQWVFVSMVMGNKLSGSIKDTELFGKLSDYKLHGVRWLVGWLS